MASAKQYPLPQHASSWRPQRCPHVKRPKFLRPNPFESEGCYENPERCQTQKALLRQFGESAASLPAVHGVAEAAAGAAKGAVHLVEGASASAAASLGSVSPQALAEALLMTGGGSPPQLALGGGSDTLLVGSVLLGVAGGVSLVGARAAGWSIGGGGDLGDLPHVYEPEALLSYWRRRPVRIAHRAATVTAEFSAFVLALRIDELTGKLRENMPTRARQLRMLVQRLGPTFIKLAQAFSTRSDLLPPEYIQEIEKLQDSVAPFPCSEAMAIMARELGRDPSEVFADISEQPVAAASLGQVYRARLSAALGGAEVAVKVLRPGVLESVAADLFILRSAAELIKDSVPMSGSTDFVALVDNWGVRFFAEMNLQTEALNAAKFRQQMQERGLGGVKAPQTYWELSSNSLLVAEWVDGRKLSESAREDVCELCNTLLNCYLVQLLDTGFLHADPHPGNLIIARDGELCILDWGLITEVDEETRVRLVEFIAHLQLEDWARVADDLTALGFVAPEGGSPRDQGLIEPLGEILGQLTRVGGGSGVNIEKVTRDLDSLSQKFPYFTIPPYFALILRAFSVIEGIALQANPSYAIVRECMPYIAQRVLSDDTPRMRELLRQLLYGDGSRLDMDRMRKLADGFVGYRMPQSAASSGQAAMGPAANAIRRPGFQEGVVDERIKQGLRLILRSGGSFSQEIIIDELVNAVDALGREALVELAGTLARTGPGARALSPLSPLSTILAPVLNPASFMALPLRRVELSEEDREALATVRSILSLLEEEYMRPAAPTRAGAPAASSAADFGQRLVRALEERRQTVRSSIALTQELLPLAGELAPGLANIWTKVTVRLLQRTMIRLQEALGSDLLPKRVARNRA